MHKGWNLSYSTGSGNPVPVLWCCMWGRSPRGNNVTWSALCQFSVTSSAPHIQLGPFWCWFLGSFVYILGPYGSLHQTFLWGWDFLLLPQPQHVFSVRGFEALFPHAGTLHYVVYSPAQFFLLIYSRGTHKCETTQSTSWCLPVPVLQPLPCHKSALPQLLISAPPIGLDECFFFNSSVVGFPFSLIFWHFWLFFVFKFVVFLLVVQEGKVYLPTPPSWPEVFIIHLCSFGAFFSFYSLFLLCLSLPSACNRFSFLSWSSFLCFVTFFHFFFYNTISLFPFCLFFFCCWGLFFAYLFFVLFWFISMYRIICKMYL